MVLSLASHTSFRRCSVGKSGPAMEGCELGGGLSLLTCTLVVLGQLGTKLII